MSRLDEAPHRRHDPLRDSWVLVSGGRSARPWRGQQEAAPAAAVPAYDPACALCPGNVRATGARNPRYRGAYVFENDFPALRPDTPHERLNEGLHRAETAAGTARVVCFSARHDRSLGALPPAARRRVVDVWARETAELGKRYRWVQVFENRGEAMGASNPHPHGQIWAGEALPSEAEREDGTQRAHFARTSRPLLEEILNQEEDGPRVVTRGTAWLAIVPFWASWPFETLLLTSSPAARLPDLEAHDRADLATVLGRLLRGYDALFDRPFPYSMGWHQAPFASGPDEAAAYWRLHAHVYPPLLRADTRKFMVGYELLAEPQRDLSPEAAAASLRVAVSRAGRRGAGA